MTHTPNLPLLLEEISTQDLLPKLVLQVQKDFELTGLSLELSTQTTASELVESVSQTIYHLVQYKFDTFMQLLYRIDVPESTMHTDTVDSSEDLTKKATFEILKREWQKIKWREKFSE